MEIVGVARVVELVAGGRASARAASGPKKSFALGIDFYFKRKLWSETEEGLSEVNQRAVQSI